MKELSDKLNTLRKEYKSHVLQENNTSADAMLQFSEWMHEAIESQVPEPHAFVLSTVNEFGQPSSRVLLLRGFSKEGVSFYTNYSSRKGHDLQTNPLACMNFFWPELERQIRIEGTTQKLTEEESLAYFNSRPRESRIGAWASRQSSVISNREFLEQEFNTLIKKFGEAEVPKPPYWGGYLLKPAKIEFWQGRENRLHDRLLYTLQNDIWLKERLSP